MPPLPTFPSGTTRARWQQWEASLRGRPLAARRCECLSLIVALPCAQRKEAALTPSAAACDLLCRNRNDSNRPVGPIQWPPLCLVSCRMATEKSCGCALVARARVETSRGITRIEHFYSATTTKTAPQPLCCEPQAKKSLLQRCNSICVFD